MKKILVSIFLLSILSPRDAESQITNQKLFDKIPFLPDHYAKKVAQFAKDPIVTGKIIFLGNSITEGGDWGDLIGDHTIVNRGIGGDVTFGVLKRLDDIIMRRPSKLFIMIGINDIGKDIPDAVIADNCRKIIERVRSGSPETLIYLQSILPVNPGYPGFPQHYDKEIHVLHTNELLRQLTFSGNVRFVNLYPLFLDDQNRLDKNYTRDGLHLNLRAYKRWITYQEIGCL